MAGRRLRDQSQDRREAASGSDTVRMVHEGPGWTQKAGGSQHRAGEGLVQPGVQQLHRGSVRRQGRPITSSRAQHLSLGLLLLPVID